MGADSDEFGIIYESLLLCDLTFGESENKHEVRYGKCVFC
jgi:hypothetical protein